MSRLQLALNVSNLEESIAFYSTLFKTPPAKVRAGYANFAVGEPPLKLVLFESSAVAGTLNHLGVEVFTRDEVAEAATYFAAEGLVTSVEDATTCCFALQDKVWVDGPDVRWEVYTVIADAASDNDVAGDGTCCQESLAVDASPRCC